jgi:hypothetical protein
MALKRLFFLFPPLDENKEASNFNCSCGLLMTTNAAALTGETMLWAGPDTGELQKWLFSVAEGHRKPTKSI